MIGEIFTIKADGKDYDFEHGDNNIALEVNAAMMTLIHQSNLDDDENINPVTLSRGFKGKVLNEIKELIIRCSHTPKLTSNKYEENDSGKKVLVKDGTYEKLDPMSIPLMFLSLYNKHIKRAKDKKKEPEKS